MIAPSKESWKWRLLYAIEIIGFLVFIAVQWYIVVLAVRGCWRFIYRLLC